MGADFSVVARKQGRQRAFSLWLQPPELCVLSRKCFTQESCTCSHAYICFIRPQFSLRNNWRNRNVPIPTQETSFIIVKILQFVPTNLCIIGVFTHFILIGCLISSQSKADMSLTKASRIFFLIFSRTYLEAFSMNSHLGI